MRSLCIVPGSHANGDTDAIIAAVGRDKWAQPTISPEYKVPEHLVADVAARARLIDAKAWSSPVLLLWNARTVHQGHHDGASAAFRPPTLAAPPFGAEPADAWLEALAKDGFVAVRIDDLDAAAAERLLCADLGAATLDDATLPQFDNTGIRMGGGLAHGEFAWYLRRSPGVLGAFRALYPGGEALRGTFGSPVISPAAEDGGAGSALRGGQWLHVDYSPPVEEGRMYQGCVYLPRDSGASDAWCAWRRTASCGRDDFREILSGKTMINRHRHAW